MDQLSDPAAMLSLTSMPWAICGTALPLSWPPSEQTLDALAARASLEPDPGEVLAGADTDDDDSEGDDAEAATQTAGPEAFDDSPDVIVIRASGLVLPRVHPLYVRWGYAIGCEQLATAIETAARAAKAVVVLFDSPGGSVAGVAEAAARIAAVSAGDTPVVAVADHLAASAAYWLAASCTALVASPSSQAGSVGVRLLRPSYARAFDEAGIDLDAIYRGEGKLDYVIWVELDTDGRARLQAGVDASYDQFTAAVATGRGLSRRVVENTWGAQLYTAAAAKAAGLVDEIRAARDVIARCGNAAGRRHYKRLGAEAAQASIMEAIVERTSEVLALGA